MSLLLWYGDGDDDAVDVGPTLHVLATFHELAKLLGDVDGYAELQSLPGFAEQRVTAWWLGEVRRQAVAVLHHYRRKLSDEAKSILGSLAAHVEHVLPDVVDPPDEADGEGGESTSDAETEGE